jgi:hypothetical protein
VFEFYVKQNRVGGENWICTAQVDFYEVLRQQSVINYSRVITLASLVRPFLIMHVRITETETRINSRLRSRRNPNMDPYHKTEIQCLRSNHNHPNVSHMYYFYGTNANDTTVDYKK